MSRQTAKRGTKFPYRWAVSYVVEKTNTKGYQCIIEHMTSPQLLQVSLLWSVYQDL